MTQSCGKCVVAAHLLPNGMIMAFDQNGEQVPEYQGRYEEVAGRLREDFPNMPLNWTEWEPFTPKPKENENHE